MPDIVVVSQLTHTSVVLSQQQGIPGAAGKSAYERAIELGIIPETMTEATWLSSIGGDKNFVHQQTSALAVWTVAHNLNKYPAVKVTDEYKNALDSDVQYVDENIVRITHGSPITGFVICN